MDGSDVVAAVALGVSGLSAGLAILSLVLAFRESSRRDEEIRLLREEAGRREEEVALIREQVAHAREERELEKRAPLTVTRGGSSGSPHGISFKLKVANAGQHFASNVLLRLRDPNGQIVGEGWHREPILPGAPAVVIQVETPPPERYCGPYTVEPAWNDGRGRIIGTAEVELTRS